MVEPGLREIKKARTRNQIAVAAARLFAEHGYENVTVNDVARAAEVAEQTVYNYFASKELLVIDREDQVTQRLCELIGTRPPGMTAAAAVRDFVLSSVTRISDVPREQWRGELGYLAAISPTVHRLALELVERQAQAVSVAIRNSTDVPPEIAELQAAAISSVFLLLIRQAGTLTAAGRSQRRIVKELLPTVERSIDELDRWFGVAGPPTTTSSTSGAAGRRAASSQRAKGTASPARPSRSR